MSVFSDLVYTMLSTIERFSMLEKGDRVLVAVSGGPDSVALLHALVSVSSQLDIVLHVAHLNHSFRGEESDMDADYVRNLCTDLGIACTTEKIDVPAVQQSLRLSPEEAARMVRYEFLERIADEVHADRLALGHNADDQVETVMLNLLRGTGIDGLAGMPPVRDRIIRPLIACRRRDIESYIEEKNIHPRNDITNLIPDYTRNRVRLTLLPMLRQEFNPDVDSAILRLAELAADDSAYLNMEAEDAVGLVTLRHDKDSLVLDQHRVLAQHLAVRRRLVREAIKMTKGELTDIGFVHVETVLKLLDSGRRFEHQLPGGSLVRLTAEGLEFLSSKPSVQPIIYCYEVRVPGTTYIPEVEAAAETEVGPGPVDPIRPRGSMDVVVDYDRIVGPLRVRNWQAGDRIRPLGLDGSKKVQDIFTDAKIPRAARYRIPVFADDTKVIWIAGLALSDEARVTELTQTYLHIRISGS